MRLSACLSMDAFDALKAPHNCAGLLAFYSDNQVSCLTQASEVSNVWYFLEAALSDIFRIPLNTAHRSMECNCCFGIRAGG